MTTQKPTRIPLANLATLERLCGFTGRPASSMDCLGKTFIHEGRTVKVVGISYGTPFGVYVR